MSRCGSCDLYWPSEDKNNFGVPAEATAAWRNAQTNCKTSC